MRRSIFIGVAALLPVVVPAIGGAQTTLYNTQAATITCNTIYGTAAVKPVLTLTPPATPVPATLTLKATLGGCTSSGATPSEPTILSGTLVAKIKTSAISATCLSLTSLGTVTGNLVFTWKTAKGQKLDSKTTIVTPGSSVSGGLVASFEDTSDTPLGSGAAEYLYLSAGGALASGVTNAFAGTATPSLFAITSEDLANVLGLCTGSGIKLIHLGIGQATL